MARILSLPTGLNKENLKLSELGINFAHSTLSWGFLGFLLGRAAIFGELWPFGLAFLGVWRVCGRSRLASLFPLSMVSIGLTSVIGLRLSLPYYGALVFLWLIPSANEREGRLWLVFACLLIKLPLHYL
ncbi:MAG: hypothetical protein GX956_04680, partial [Firmicutes bacterium]|nr:hypothetical protein [Bacillota bacterium]